MLQHCYYYNKITGLLNNRFGSGYVITVGKGRIIKSYNGKGFETKEDAAKAAEYFAFLIFNGHNPDINHQN